ncbi:hypothetical protein Taro_003645 [Colocasia esculenta]|uniref:Uncharacterized protein n=1 Tax=Colocasia esculenta TaxID=4460 RepID=A0A843TPE1_COLES|nr:hypothetical protein [Colocasia esculenta]
MLVPAAPAGEGLVIPTGPCSRGSPPYFLQLGARRRGSSVSDGLRGGGCGAVLLSAAARASVLLEFSTYLTRLLIITLPGLRIRGWRRELRALVGVWRVGSLQAASEKNLRQKEAEAAKERERDLSALKKSLEAVTKAQYDVIAAHEDTKKGILKLIAEEREKVIEEYRESDELQDEVAGLFREGYVACLDKVRELFPNLDFSAAYLPSDGDEVSTKGCGEAVGVAVDEALNVVVDCFLEEAADNVLAEDLPPEM